MESGNIIDAANKLDLITSVLASLRYDAVGIGETDRAAGGPAFSEVAAKNNLPLVDACPGSVKTISPYVVKIVDGVRVGVFSFGVRDPSASNEYEARKAMFAAYKDARAGSDILVVLDQSGTVTEDWLERNGARFGAPDLVVGGLSAMGLSGEKLIGRTRFMPTSYQGKAVGIVDVELAPGQEPKYASRLTILDEKVEEDQATTKLVKDFMMKLQGITSAAAPVVQHQSPDPASVSKPYYSVGSCKTCHQKEYENWAASKHAQAIPTLVSQNRMVPECLTCHSEMYRRVQRAEAPGVGTGGVECASCHIQALPHGMERKSVTAKTKVDVRTCQVCHTKERSPRFDEKSYFAQVTHVADAQAHAAPGGKALTPVAPSPPALVAH